MSRQDLQDTLTGQSSIATSKQAVIRLHTGSAPWGSSQWVGKLKTQAQLERAPWDDIAVSQSGSALSLIARSPKGSEWLERSTDDVLRSCIDVLGRVARIELLNLDVQARYDTPYLWAYNIPRLVVAKDGDWTSLAAVPLADATRDAITNRINSRLAQQAKAWGIARSPTVALLTDGRPMPLKEALRAGAHGSSKALTVMARLDVRVVSEARLEGAWFAGLLPGLGYGRMFRTGYATVDEVQPTQVEALGVEI